MNVIGRKKVLVFGFLLLAISLFIIGLIEFSGLISTLILSIVSRILAGIGAGCSMTSAPAILISECPDETDKVIGYFEAASGLGLLIGPLFGSILSLTRMIVSFSVISGLFLLFAIMIYFFLGDITHKELKIKKLKLTNFLKKPVNISKKITIDLCAQALLLFSLGYISTVLELHLLANNIPSVYVGFYYSICTFTYFFTSIFENKISNLCSQKYIIAAGIFLTSIAFVLIGPWEAILPNNIIVISVGLALFGFSGSIMYGKVYLVPTTSHVISLSTNFYGYEYNNVLLDSITALNNFFSNIGEILGPIIAGVLSSYLGYANGFSIIGGLYLIFFVVYVLVSGIFERKRTNKVITEIQIIHTDTEKDLINSKIVHI